MVPYFNRLGTALALCVIGCVIGFSLHAQGPHVSSALPGVDLTGLSAAQQATVMKLIQTRDCGCTCGMKVAECRVKDPSCSYSKGLAAVIVAAIKSGKSEKDALAAAEASQWSHMPEADTRILSDKVAIPTLGSPVIGPKDAVIHLVEFSDFQCPFCIVAYSEIHAVLKAYPNQVNLTFKQFPLDSHSEAALAAAAALAAQKQGKFWEMHDSLFTQKGQLSRAVILSLAGSLGLDRKKFAADLDSAELKQAVEKDVADGERAGVSGTPTIFINGQRYNGPVDLKALKPVLDAQLKTAPASATTAAIR